MNPFSAVITYAVGAALALLLIIAGVQTGRLSSAHTEIAALKLQASDKQAASDRALAAETQKSRQFESAWRLAKDQQEKTDAIHSKTVSDLAAKLRTRLDAGGLRDPYAAACDRGGAAPTTSTAAADRPADGGEAGRLLSPELGEFLIEQAEQADRINVAFASCRADAQNIRTVKDPQ